MREITLKYNYLFGALCFVFLFSPFSVFGADDTLKIMIDYALQNDEICNIRIDDYYMPRELLKKYMDDGYDLDINAGNIIKIMNMYSDEIDHCISKPRNSNYDYLQCAMNLNKSEEKMINAYASEIALNLLKDKNYMGLPYLDGFFLGTSVRVCTQYNKIAFSFEKNNMYDKAEEIYRYVVSTYDKVPGCAKEAEISLQKVNAIIINSKKYP